MSTKKKVPFRFQATDGLVLAMSSRLYGDPAVMVGELVINGFDAATRRGVRPEIEVRFWSAGEHPLSPDASVLTVTDNGTGFTDAVIADYILVGESAHGRDARFHGVHGIGKCAAFGLSDTQRFRIITRPQGKRQVVQYSIAAEDVFSGREIKAEPIVVQMPGVSGDGSFTCIMVSNFNGAIVPEELRERLTRLLPIRPCSVKVQGVPVVLRRLEAEREVETPPLPVLDNKTVRIRLAVAEVTNHHDQVRIIDTETGRPVAVLDSLPSGVRRQLEPVLLHPKLQGEIWVPGNIEKQSGTGRVGLSSEYWRSEQGGVLILALNTYGVPLAKELVGGETEQSRGPVGGRLGEVAELFKRSFGDPSDAPSDDDDEDGPSPDGKPKPKPHGPPRPGKGGGGKGKPKKRSDSPPPPGGVQVRVEDMVYTVMSFPCTSSAPGHVRSGRVVVINTNHPQVARLQSLKGTRVRDELARYVIEAHVAAVCDAGADLFGRVYQILGRLRL